MDATTPWKTTAPPMFPPRSTPTAVAPWAVVELLLPIVTFPLTAPVRMPTLLSPRTVILLPVAFSEPVSALSMAMPADALPSIVMVPLLVMLPV